MKGHWQSLYARDAKDYESVLADEVPWQSWELNTNPESSAEAQLMAAIMILSGSDNWMLAGRYLDLASEMVDRIFAEDRLRASVDYPRNRAETNRTKVFAESLKGQPWNSPVLLVASQDYEAHCKDNYPEAQVWHPQTQYYYLNAVHMALLGDDVRRAGALLESPPYPLKDQRDHVQMLNGLVQFIRNELGAEQRTKFLANCDAYFDLLRDPRQKLPTRSFIERSMAAVQLALLRDRYITHANEPIDWRRVLEDYAH